MESMSSTQRGKFKRAYKHASHVERERWFYEGRRYGASLRRSDDGRRNSLFARELAGTDIVNFNLYRLGPGIASLKPCEMSAEKVRDFVLGLRLSASGLDRAEEDRGCWLRSGVSGR